MIKRLAREGAAFRRTLVVLASGLTGMALAFLYIAQAPALYETSGTVLVSSVTRSGDNDPLTETNDAQQKVLTLATLATSNVVVERAIASSGVDRTPESLRDSLEAEAVPQTVLVEITARDPDPAQAREIVNFVALELDGYVQELNEQSPTAAAETSAQLVDPALTPTQPVSPQPTLMLALGLFGGLATGLVLMTVVARRDDHLRTEAALEQSTGLANLGSVPLVSGSQLTPTDIANRKALTQNFHRIRNNLLALFPSGGSVVAIVGLEKGEGKTSLTLGLANALVRHGRRILVVDADPHRHHLTSGLGLENEMGWCTRTGATEAPSRTAVPPSRLVIKDDASGLDVLPAGVPAQRSRVDREEDSVVQALEPVLNELRHDYDLVLLDTADLRSCADSALLASYADGSVLVVPAGLSRQGDVALAMDMVRKASGVILGTVLNYAPRSFR